MTTTCGNSPPFGSSTLALGRSSSASRRRDTLTTHSLWYLLVDSSLSLLSLSFQVLALATTMVDVEVEGVFRQLPRRGKSSIVAKYIPEAVTSCPRKPVSWSMPSCLVHNPFRKAPWLLRWRSSYTSRYTNSTLLGSCMFRA